MFPPFIFVLSASLLLLNACGEAYSPSTQPPAAFVRSSAAPASVPSSDLTDRLQLVDQYFNAVGFRDMQRQMIQQMAADLPAEHRAQFLDTLQNKVRWDTIEQAAKDSLARHMTREELTAFVAFAQKPEGQSALAKMALYTADLTPVVQQEVFRAVAAQ